MQLDLTNSYDSFLAVSFDDGFLLCPKIEKPVGIGFTLPSLIPVEIFVDDIAFQGPDFFYVDSNMAATDYCGADQIAGMTDIEVRGNVRKGFMRRIEVDCFQIEIIETQLSYPFFNQSPAGGRLYLIGMVALFANLVTLQSRKCSKPAIQDGRTDVLRIDINI